MDTLDPLVYYILKDYIILYKEDEAKGLLLGMLIDNYMYLSHNKLNIYVPVINMTDFTYFIKLFKQDIRSNKLELTFNFNYYPTVKQIEHIKQAYGERTYPDKPTSKQIKIQTMIDKLINFKCDPTVFTISDINIIQHIKSIYPNQTNLTTDQDILDYYNRLKDFKPYDYIQFPIIYKPDPLESIISLSSKAI